MREKATVLVSCSLCRVYAVVDALFRFCSRFL